MRRQQAISNGVMWSELLLKIVSHEFLPTMWEGINDWRVVVELTTGTSKISPDFCGYSFHTEYCRITNYFTITVNDVLWLLFPEPILWVTSLDVCPTWRVIPTLPYLLLFTFTLDLSSHHNLSLHYPSSPCHSTLVFFSLWHPLFFPVLILAIVPCLVPIFVWFYMTIHFHLNLLLPSSDHGYFWWLYHYRILWQDADKCKVNHYDTCTEKDEPSNTW